jgi:hypothetical protein
MDGNLLLIISEADMGCTHSTHGKLTKCYSLSLYAAKCPVRDEASNLNTEDVIMCGILTAVAYRGGGGVMDEYGAMVE